MPLAQQTLKTAIKGLITERQELVFPEDASVDELNCDLSLDGTRSRRNGLVLEDDTALSGFTVAEDEIVNTDDWKNVGGISNLEFLVIQIGDILYFYDKSMDPTGDQQKFALDLNSFSANNGKTISEYSFQGASLDGVYVVVHPGCNAFYISYNFTTDSISTSVITHKIRDFEWQGDTSTYAVDAPLPVSMERTYDTINAGWNNDPEVASPLSSYVALQNAYPRLTHAWYTGRESFGHFSAPDWLEVYSGNTLISNGHFILNFFSKDREAVVAGMGVETESSRFTTVEAFAGRFWYAGLESEENGSKILFSKVIESERDYGICYQENDPVAEDISDLLDSDGGVINIPEAYGIRKLYAYGPSLLVFADNGVWIIKGVDQVFKATEFSVSKITGIGILTENSFVNAEGTPFWWSRYGIHSMTQSEITGNPQEANISEGTIQTFWEAIDNDSKYKVKSLYNPVEKKIYWLYPNNSESIVNKHNNLLILSIPLQAFTPWKIADQSSNTHYVLGLSFFNLVGVTGNMEDVTVGGVTVTVGGVDVTVDNEQTTNLRDTLVKLLVKEGATDKLTFATFTGTDFLDWTDTNFSSYFELGYAFFNSLTVRKSPMMITTYFKITESGFVDNGDGSYDLKTPSSCVMNAYWDFKDTPSSTQQVYRLKRYPVVDPNDLNTFDYGSSVLINRTRVKGRGRVVNLKFESEQEKDFQFLGYELMGTVHEGF